MDTQTSRTERLKMALVADGYAIDSAPLAGALRMARQLERELANMTDQRDRLAVAGKAVVHCLLIYGQTWNGSDEAKALGAALAAVEGGSNE